MLVVYIGMHDEVEVDGLLELVPRDTPVEVPDSMAGRAPSGHRADVDEDGISTFDPGEGLLAQTENWQAFEEPQETPAQRKAREKAEAAAAQEAAEAAAAAAGQGNDNTEGQAQ